MENLNAEAVKKALECCVTTSEGDCIACGYRGKKDGLFITCTNCLMADALALITSQEQRIAELEVELKAMRGAANSYKMHLVELTEENERLRAENAKYEAENHAEFNKWLKLEEATKRHHAELFEEAKIAVKADTVRKMQTIISEKYAVSKVHYVKGEEPTITYQLTNWDLRVIAKEMLEGEK